MPSTHDAILQTNNQYATNFGDKSKLAIPPACRFAILTCMDTRLDPTKYADLAEGDAHIIRIAGGRTSDDAIRSLVIFHGLLGTHERFVIRHSDYGMQTFTDEIIGDPLDDNLETAGFDGKTWSNPTRGGGSVCGLFINWRTVKDQPRSVVEDDKHIRWCPGDPGLLRYLKLRQRPPRRD